MDIQVVTDAVSLEDAIRGGMTALATVGGFIVTGFVGLLIYYLKLKLQKKVNKDEERGPVLHKNEHDADCDIWRNKHDERADKKHDEVIDTIKSFEETQRLGFAKVEISVDAVHKRIDAHLEAEASRG